VCRPFGSSAGSEEWKAFVEGTTIGRELTLHFEPTVARHVRLNILKATEGPPLWEFQLFGK